MQKILFVCLGNICRSPLAEGIMLHLKSKHNLQLEIDSAGTANYHVGEAPDRRTIANAKKKGVDLSSLRARQFSAIDFENFDKIYAMDKNNFKNILALAKKESHKNKVSLFLSGEPSYEDEVPDPYYGTESDFENVFWLVYEKCEQLAGIKEL
ncbi:low molecular weight protein-tyrosine-phosphatase [Aurantibacillus circumpalustris]|uniref:low molecular weight protein-tyrosine-phosphatase n=1 Tax=Aurantibacillus circumpalustris TaxID=3036359 RepID=UPI00295BC8EA|nr:low molecular weight protein-tyrosine-phosphatase [Aurantibacillus circumpalustris]